MLASLLHYERVVVGRIVCVKENGDRSSVAILRLFDMRLTPTLIGGHVSGVVEDDMDFTLRPHFLAPVLLISDRWHVAILQVGGENLKCIGLVRFLGRQRAFLPILGLFAVYFQFLGRNGAKQGEEVRG